MKSFGRRLKEERLALGHTQASLASIGEVARATQLIYENDVRVPDVRYLARVQAVGIDAMYLLTGNRGRSETDWMLRAERAVAKLHEYVTAHPTELSLENWLHVFRVLCFESVKADSSSKIA